MNKTLSRRLKTNWRSLSGSYVTHDVGRVYFESALARFRAIDGLPECVDDPAAKVTIGGLLEKYNMDPEEMSLSEAVLFERMIVRILPSSRLLAALFQTRAQLKQVIAADDFQEYLKQVAALPQANESQLRAELDELLAMIHKTYIFSPLREDVRSQVSRRLTLGLCLFTVFTLALCTIAEPPYLIVAMLMGALGGMISVQFRVQALPSDGDAIRGSLLISNGIFGVYFSPVVGAVSAAVLYMMFCGGMISGNLFPEFAKSRDEITEISHFVVLSSLSAESLAKLILWSFVAGFSERLVPDTVTRLSDAISSQKFATSDATVNTPRKTLTTVATVAGTGTTSTAGTESS